MRFLYEGLALLVLAAQPLGAVPIEYTVAGQLSGHLGSTTLTNVSFVFTFSGDTSNITALTGSSSVVLNPATPTTISIGAANGSFTTAVDAVVNDVSGIIGFGDPTVQSGIIFPSGGTAGYKLATAIGPLTSSSGISAGGSFGTSLGALEIDSATNVSFQATVGAPATFFNGAVSLGSGVYYLQFPNGTPFGYYTFVSNSILYHYDMGYEAFIPGSAADVYLYDFQSQHWWYTSPTSFPYLYDFTLNSWLYYEPASNNPGHYTSDPQWFYEAAKGQWVNSLAPPRITTTSPLPDGCSLPCSYSLQFAAQGGAGPYTWSVPAGSSLPPGLSLSSAGVLSGSTTSGQYTFTVQVRDSSNQTASAVFVLNIAFVKA